MKNIYCTRTKTSSVLFLVSCSIRCIKSIAGVPPHSLHCPILTRQGEHCTSHSYFKKEEMGKR